MSTKETDMTVEKLLGTSDILTLLDEIKKNVAFIKLLSIVVEDRNGQIRTLGYGDTKEMIMLSAIGQYLWLRQGEGNEEV